MTFVHKILPQDSGCDAPAYVRSLITLDEALQRIVVTVAPIAGREQVPLAQATGRVLAEPVVATAPSPPFDNAAMDGYAIDARGLAGDGPYALRVSGRVAAGQPDNTAVSGSCAVRIFTGAPVPEGATAVIPQEAVTRDKDTILISTRPEAGAHIRRAGSDMRAGDVVVHAGTRLGMGEIAACAAAGVDMVSVRRPLRVAVLVSGDEVRQAGSMRNAAQIWDVNTPMLLSALSDPAIQVLDVLTVKDTRAGLTRRLAELSVRVDLIVTTGGISVGEEDHVKPALAALGAEIVFSGVALKPGKPVSFGRVGDAYWLGLPGNPQAAFSTWQVLGTAVVKGLLGSKDKGPSRRQVVLANAIHRKPGRTELRAARIVGRDATGLERVDFEDAVRSGQVAGLPNADGLVVIPADCAELPIGSKVEFQQFCRN